MNAFHSRCTFLTAFFSVFLLAAGAKGDLITTLDVAVSPNGPAYLYGYTLTNDSASDLNVILVSIDIADSASLTGLSGPTGWDIVYQLGDTTVTWESPDPLFNLLPGNSFQFEFSSILPPDLQDFILLGIDNSATNFAFNTGRIASPSSRAVPEPSSLLALGYGLLFLIAARELRRQQER